MTLLLHRVRQLMQPHALQLLLIGLAAVAAYNWRLWQRDKALADRLRGERAAPPAPLARRPKISALVAAWNEQANIAAHVESFLALSYPNIELVLCAGGADDTLQIARRYAGERVIVLEQRAGEGKQKALARCLEHASGEIIYLTDADCLFDDEALVRLLAPIVNEGEQAATGGIRPLDRQSEYILPNYAWATDVVAHATMPTYINGLRGANTAVTRAAIDCIGGLDFDARTGTDYQLAQRLVGQGVRLRAVATSVVPTEYAETLHMYRKRQSRWLLNLLIHGRRYAARDDLRVTQRTIAIGAAMVLAPLSALWLGALIMVPWTLLVFHATAAKLRYVLFAARLHRRGIPKRLFAALAPLTLIDFAVWAAPLLDVIHPERREQW